MSNQGEHFSITALQSCKLLILTGQPIAEPINGHGPFVMNTYDEILQAYDDILKWKICQVKQTSCRMRNK